MANTIQKSDSAFMSFLDRLHKAGVKDGQIDGAVADDVAGGPGIGTCKVGAPRDGKIDRAEVFALALNNLTSHGDTVRRFFHQIGFSEIDQLQNNGQFGDAYRKKVQSELLGSEPRRSLKAWPNPDKLKPEDPSYAKDLVAWSLKNTRLSLLPFNEQLEVFRKIGLEESAVKAPLAKHWQDLTLPKILAQASVLKGEDIIQEARDRRRVGGIREAQELEGMAHRLFQTAVELDGKNAQGRLRLAESFEGKERFTEAGLHYAQAIVDGIPPADVDKILERLSFESGHEMLGKYRDAFSFVGAHLMEAGRYVEAASLYHRAAEVATTAGQHRKSLRFTELEMRAQEKVSPYTQDFSAESNPVAHALYRTLRDAGIPSALLDGASGKEGDVPDRKITAAEVFGYLDSNWSEKRIQRAMDKIGFEFPWLDAKGRVKKEFNTPEFSKLNLAQRFGVWHDAQAKRLKGDGIGGDAGLIEKHLKFATYYDGGNAERHKALGDFYLGQKNGPQAKAAYAAALLANPGYAEVALPMARAKVLSGEKVEALKSFQAYLAANPSDGVAKKECDALSSEVLSERTKAFDGQLSAYKLLSATHPDKAEKALKDLESTLGELQSLRSGGPEQSYERLLRTKAFYDAAIDFRNSNTPSRNFWDSTQYDTYQAKTTELEKARTQVGTDITALLEGEIRPAMTASGVSTGDELAMAKLALRIDRETGNTWGSVSDLQTAVALVQALPPSTSASEKADHYASLLREWSDIGSVTRKNLLLQGLVGLTPAAAKNLEDDLRSGILDNSPVMEREKLKALIDGALSGETPQLRDFLKPGGLKQYLEQVSATDTAFADAMALKDPKQQRGAMLGVLSSYAKLGRSEQVDAVLKAVDSTFTEKTKDEDKLYMTTALLGALRGSGLPQEKALRKQGDDLARMMAVCASDPRVNVKRRMAELAYYSSVGDAKGMEEAQRGLSKVGDDLLNFLFAGNPDAKIPKPTDAKTRIELASLTVEIDVALLGFHANDSADPKSHGSAALSTKLPRLEILRREIEKAKGLPAEEKIAALGLLSRASATYEPLTKGDKPLLSPADLKKANAGTETLVGKAFEELLQQPADATAGQQKMATKIAEDFKARYAAAVKAGDQAWLSNLTPQAIVQFAKASQDAHALLLEAEDLKGPRGFEKRLQAAKVFGEMGVGERVKESLEPVKLYADTIKDPKNKAGFLFTLAQLYQSGGQKSEADAAFRSIEALGGPGASPAIQEFATLATGLRELNSGDTSAAQATLASIPENPTAQILLGALRQNVETRRMATSVAVLRSVSLNFLERGKEATFGGFSKDEYENLKRDTLAGWDEVHRLVASGEVSNLGQAIEEVSQDSRFKGFRTGFSRHYGADPHSSDTSEYHIASNVGYFMQIASNPSISERDFAAAAYELANMVSADGYYSAKAGILDVLKDDPHVGKIARESLDSLPTEIKVRSGINIAWNVISFAAGPAGIMAANSTSGAGGGDYVENVAMALVPFGIARAFAVGAEAVYVARAASLIRNPTLFKAGGFLVGKSAEAAGFTLGNMAMLTVLKGKTDQWTLKHFGQEFGTMLVTFALLHGAGMALKGVGTWSGRAVGRAEADMARALETGSGLQAASFRLRFTSGMESVAKSGMTAWGTRVMAFTGAEYFTEAIGLKHPEPGIPFWARLLSSAVMDAQMIVAGRKIDALSGGRIGQLEKASHQKYAEHELGYETKQLLPVVQGMGFDPASPAGKQALQTLLASRYGGESLASITKRAETDKTAYEKIVKEQLGLDPKSGGGKEAMALLMGYAQHHAFAGPGKPIAAAEVAKHSAEFFDAATKLLEGAGLERNSAPLAGMRRGLVAFALRTGMDPALLADYAKHAPALKPSLKKAAEGLLGPDGSRTPEGQALIGELLVFSMFRAGSPDKMATPLEPLLHPEVAADLRKDLTGQAQLLFGKGGEETPAGRQLMSFLLIRAAHSGESLSELPTRIGGGKETLANIPILSTVTGLNKPGQRLALARWALEKGIVGENVNGLSRLVIKGKLEVQLVHGEIQVFRVPEGQRAAKSKEVLDRLPELPPQFVKADRAGDAKTEQEIFHVTDDMIIPIEDSKAGTGKEEILPVTDDMIISDPDSTVVVSYDAKTRVVKGEGDLTVKADEAKTRAVKSDSDVTKVDTPKKPPVLAKETSDGDGTVVLGKKAKSPAEDSGENTKVDRLAARKGGTPKPKLEVSEGVDALGDSRSGGNAFGAKLSSTDGKIDLKLDFRQGNVLYLGGRAGLREASISLETLDAPQAEVALVKSGAKSFYRIKPLSKGRVEFYDAAKDAWMTVGPEGLSLKSGQRLKIGGEEVHWEPPVAKLKSVVSSKDPPFDQKVFDALFETRRNESTELVGLVETLNTGPKLPENDWLSSSANESTPNLAHSPVYAAWKHFTVAETKVDYEANGAALAAIAEYRVDIRGEQRMADTVARLKGEYGKRLVEVDSSPELGAVFVLQSKEGKGFIRISLQSKPLDIPSAAEAREALADFQKNHLPDLLAVAKEPGLRGNYAQKILSLVGYAKGAEGKEVAGKNLEAVLEAAEKAPTAEERARAKEEMARIVAYLRDVPILKAEETLVHRSVELLEGETMSAIKWLETSDSKAGKAAWEDYSQLVKNQKELRDLGQELLSMIPQAQQKPGNKVYDEYMAARQRLDGSLGRLEKALKEYQASEQYGLDQAARKTQFKSTPKEEPVFEVTDDMILDGETTKVGKTPQKARLGGSDQGPDLRLFNQAEIAWLGAFGVAGSEKLANPQSAEYGQTLFNGVDLLLKNPRGDVSHYEWAITRLVGALRHTAHAEGGTWQSWLKETLEPTLAAHGRGSGGVKLPPIPLNADQQAYLSNRHREITAENVMAVIQEVKSQSTNIGTSRYPSAFKPNGEGREILSLALKRFGGVIKAKDAKLFEYLDEGLFPRTEAQAYPGADPKLADPVAARAGTAGALSGGKVGGPAKIEMDASRGYGADLAGFLSDRSYLADSINLPGVKMTPELRSELKNAEMEFEQGGMVFELHPGKPMLMKRLSGAETMMTEPASPAMVKFYETWKTERSFELVDAATAKQAYSELKSRADSLGIKLFLGEMDARGKARDLDGDIRHHGGALVYLNQLLKLLPDSMLSNLHLKQIHLNVPRQGAGLLSSYDPGSGSVFLYTGSFTGARRYMAALLFHELGHSTAERYKSDKSGDATIPLPVRKTMEKAHRTLADSNAMLGLDWAAGAEHRAGYQGSFTEFLAELNMMYVTAGPKLRAHIASFKAGSEERLAWDFVYSEMRDRVFKGREYDYSGIKPVVTAKPALKPVPAAEAKVDPKLGEPNRDYIPTKDMPDHSTVELVLTPALDSPYTTKDPYIMIPADPSVSQAQLFGLLMKRGSEVWFSPQQKDIRVSDATGKLRGLRGSQSPMKLNKGDSIEVGLFKFKFDGENLVPNGKVEMQRIDPKPAVAPATADAVLQDNTDTQPRQGSVAREATAEYGSVSAHTDEGIGYAKAGKPAVNEDGFVQGSNWAIVLDGMGGMGGGDKASAVAGREFQRMLEDPSFTGNMAEAMILAGRKVNTDVNGGAGKTGQSGTAAVAHRIAKQTDGSYQLEWAVSGDAGAILFRSDGKGGYEPYFRTDEQSMVGEYRRAGILKNTLVARQSPNANIVTDGLGLNKDANPLSGSRTINPGDRLLMFSDGIGDSFSKEELGHLLRGTKTPEEAQTRIVDAAHAKMAALKKGKAELKAGQNVFEIHDGQNGTIDVVAVDGLRGFYMGGDGTVYGRAVEFRDGSGAIKYGVEVPWAQGQYYVENARGETQVIAGTFKGDRGYYSAVDKYKADNLTVHVYFHDVVGAKAAPKAKSDPAAVDPDAKTQIFLKPATAKQNQNGSWEFLLQDQQVLKLGRNPGVGQIELLDQTVSRSHADIFLNQGEYWVRDNGSTSGTYVNGRRVGSGDSLSLGNGDKVQFGNSKYTFETLSNGSVRLTPSN